MPGDPEPSVPNDEEGKLLDDAPRTDPMASPRMVDEMPPSSVRASAPTIQGDSDPGRPVLIRTPVPPSRLDLAVPALSTTTPTGGRPTSQRPQSGRSLVGQSLGRYEIFEELGHGGMATVYRARDPRLERDVALKVIHRHLRDNPEIAQRFRHEARAVAKLKHPSIVEIYDVPDAEDEERFLVAEFVDGPSLRKYLQGLRSELGNDHPGLFPPEIAAALLLQVVSALARAHQEGIVHRDVKPENILISGLGGPTSQRPSDPSRTPPVAKLTDFGIAKILDAQSMTSTGQILGSPAHMAPEQIEAGEITAKVDIFACGVLFYELLTGTLPFDGKNPAQVIRRVLEGDFTPADRLVAQVGGRWSAIVASMLARDPERRPASVSELESILRRELEAMGVVDPNRELVDFLRDPKTVATSWGARVKPRLLERALEAREKGDVVGGANDLNRALAYDPSDPKLVRAVSTMRSRERRLRSLKRAVPIALAAIVVSAGTFGIVRWTKNRATTAPPPTISADTNVAPPASVPIPTTPPTLASVTAAPVDAAVAPPSSASVAPSTAPSTVTPPSHPDAAIGPSIATGKRKVRFNIFPAANYSIDGGAAHDSFVDPAQELAVGTHSVSVTGHSNCCEPKTVKIVVEAGEGEQAVSITLDFLPHRIYVPGVEGATVTVKKGGVLLASGPAPLTVKMTETKVENATVTVTAPGFAPRTETYNLVPGDPRYFTLEKIDAGEK